MSAISGYDYGTPRAADSPVTLEELRALEQTAAGGDRAERSGRSHESVLLEIAFWARPYTNEGLW